jgi:hypothetical protein
MHLVNSRRQRQPQQCEPRFGERASLCVRRRGGATTQGVGGRRRGGSGQGGSGRRGRGGGRGHIGSLGIGKVFGCESNTKIDHEQGLDWINERGVSENGLIATSKQHNSPEIWPYRHNRETHQRTRLSIARRWYLNLQHHLNGVLAKGAECLALRVGGRRCRC